MASQNDLSNLIQLKDIYIGENFEERTHIFQQMFLFLKILPKLKFI
jgi:hypothetical protein